MYIFEILFLKKYEYLLMIFFYIWRFLEDLNIQNQNYGLFRQVTFNLCFNNYTHCYLF